MPEPATNTIPEAAKQLAHAHAARLQIEPGRWARLPDMDAAYTVQRHFLGLVGGGHGGWKVGVTSPDAQARRKLDGPALGRLAANRVFHAPKPISRDLFVNPYIEIEFGFRMKRDADLMSLPADGRREGVLRAIGAVFLAVEIVDGRLAEWKTCDGLSAISDNIAHGATVIGPRLEHISLDGLGAVATSLLLDGREVATGSGGAVMGNPVSAVLWLADALEAQGESFRAGDFILSGTTTGVSPLGSARVVEARFSNLGSFAFEFI